MALGQAGWAAVAFTGPGLLAFIFAVVAENKKVMQRHQFSCDLGRDSSSVPFTV